MFTNRFFQAAMFFWLLLVFSVFFLKSAYSKTHFVIGVQDFDNYLPYSQYNKETNDYKGFNRLLFDLFAATKGYSFEYRAMSIKRLYEDFLNGQVDMKYPDNENWLSQRKADYPIVYSLPTVEFIDGILLSPDNMNQGLDNLKTVGIVSGYTPFAYLEKKQKGQIKIIEFDSIQQLLLLSSKQRINAAYFNIAVGKFYQKNLPDVHLVFDQNLPYSQGTRHLSSIKYPDIIAEFNSFLVKNSAQIEALKQHYQVEPFSLP